jgi:hypothetical protein
MVSIQRRISAVTDSTAHLVAQLRELDELREQVRTALLLRAPRMQRRTRNGTIRAFSKWQSPPRRELHSISPDGSG